MYSCGHSRYKGTALALHSLSVTYCTAASKQFLSQQSRSQLACCHPEVLVGRIIRSFFTGSFERKLSAFSFSFNCRTSKMTVVLSVKQKARPAELRGSGGQTRRFTELGDCWIVVGRGLSPSVISHPLQPYHQTTTGQNFLLS